MGAVYRKNNVTRVFFTSMAMISIFGLAQKYSKNKKLGHFEKKNEDEKERNEKKSRRDFEFLFDLDFGHFRSRFFRLRLLFKVT